MNPVDRMRQFVSECVAPRLTVPVAVGFPRDLWEELGRAGLLGLYLPTEFGGHGGDARLLAEAGEALGEGGDPGLTISWMGHNLISGFIIARLATPEQKSALLPAMAEGTLTPAVAISEPDAGAHPKLLSARAEWEGETVVINGDKQWVTNGTIAGIYIVLAITGLVHGRKQFSAFLVPRDAPGLTVEPMGDFTALRSSPHARLKLRDCRIPATALLGPAGEAFETIGRPLREVEDAAGLGPLCGGLRAQLRLLASAVAPPGAQGAEAPPGAQGDKALMQTLGGLSAQVDGIGHLARAAASALDSGASGDDLRHITLAGREWARRFQSQVVWVKKEGLPGAAPELERLSSDLEVIINLSRRIDQGRLYRMGESLITKEA